MKNGIKYICLCFSLLAVFLVATRPDKVPSVLLIVPFVLLFAILSLLLAMFLSWRGHSGLTVKNLRTGAVISILPTLLLVLQSLGQLTVRDLFIIVVLFGVGYFYMSRVGIVSKPSK